MGYLTLTAEDRSDIETRQEALKKAYYTFSLLHKIAILRLNGSNTALYLAALKKHLNLDKDINDDTLKMFYQVGWVKSQLESIIDPSAVAISFEKICSMPGQWHSAHTDYPDAPASTIIDPLVTSVILNTLILPAMERYALQYKEALASVFGAFVVSCMVVTAVSTPVSEFAALTMFSAGVAVWAASTSWAFAHHLLGRKAMSTAGRDNRSEVHRNILAIEPETTNVELQKNLGQKITPDAKVTTATGPTTKISTVMAPVATAKPAVPAVNTVKSIRNIGKIPFGVIV